MSKLIKKMLAEQVEKEIGSHNSACVVDMTGMNGLETTKLRAELAKKNIRLRVVKNSAAKQGLKGGKLNPLGEKMLGVNAIVFGGESIMDVAKELVRFKTEFKALKLKGGIVEGDPGILSVEEISKLPTRAESLSQLLALVLSPGGRVAGALRGPGGRIAGLVKAVEKKQEQAA